MSKHSVVRGFVVDRSSGLGVVGARVEAWDASRRVRDLVAFARSGEGGSFSMELSAEQRAALFGDSAAILSFRVFDGTSKDLLFDGAKSEMWRLDDRATEVTLRVVQGRPIISLPKHAVAVVKGQITGADGPVVGVYVKAYDENLGALTALGAPAQTDSTGGYRITYDPAALPNGKDRPDLIVKAYSSLSLLVEVAVSNKLSRAPALATLHAVRPGERWQGKPGFSSVYARVSSLLGSNNLGALDASQRSALAFSSGLAQRDIDAVSLAAKLHSDYSSLSHEIAFGLLRRGLSADADSFFRHPKNVVRQELRAAIDDNLVPQTYDAQIESILSAQWAPAAAAWALQPRNGEVCGLREVLDAAGVSDSGIRLAFAQEYCSHEGAPSDFWSAQTSLGAEDKAKVQLALQHWTLARGHKPLLSYLSQSRATYPTFDSLVSLSEADWLAIVSQSAIGAPASIPGATTAEQQASYARLLAFTISHAFPMKAFRKRAETGGDAEIQDFLVNHSSFEFGKDRLSKDVPSATPRVRAYERVYRLIPRYEPAKALIDAGYRSAHDVVQRGKDRFVSEMATALGGEETATATWKKAAWQAGASSMLFAKYSAAANKVQIPVLPNFVKTFEPSPEHPVNDIPDWTSLFGTAGGCACKHCASVLSASAYLVDLLQWLDGFASEVPRPTSGSWSALDVLVGADTPAPGLTGRRPDLKRLELTCKAANTPLPYIDLVNEILEVVVAAKTGGPAAGTQTIATTYDAEELLANPEILPANAAAHSAAWEAVSQAVYPFSLPVDLWAEETNAYLRYLGVSRSEILSSLPPLNQDDSAVNPDDLAKARLGVRAAGYQLLQTGGQSDAAVAEAWGGFANVAELAPVPVFLKRAGLSFEELEELLSTRFANGTSASGIPGLGALAISHADGCDVTAMSITGLSLAHLARLHPFLRLVRRTGLSITELDRVLAAFAQSQSNILIDATMLQKVTQAQALSARLSLPVTDVLSFCGPLDTWEKHDGTSPFRRAFIDRSVDSADHDVLVAMLTSESGLGTIEEHRAILLRTLGISSGDFDLLTNETALNTALSLPSGELLALATDDITIAGVSRLYAFVTLARALRLSIRDLLVLRALTGGAVNTSLAGTAQLCDVVDDLRSGSLSVPEIHHVLRGVAPASSGLGASAAAIEALRDDLIKSVDLIVAETSMLEDVDGARTLALLKHFVTVPADATAMFDRLLDGTGSPATFAPIVSCFPDEAQLYEDVAVTGLNVPPALASATERFSLVAKWLERHVRSERAIVEKLAATHKLPAATMQHLLSSAIVPAPSDPPTLNDFLPARRDDTAVATPSPKARQTRDLLLLERHARLLHGLDVADPLPAGPDGVPSADLGEVLWVYPASPPTLGLHNLPDSAGSLTDAAARFGLLRSLIRRMALKARLAGGPDALRRIFNELPSAPDKVSLLAELTGWEQTTVSEMNVTSSYDQTTTAATIETDLLRLERVVQLCRRLGMSSVDAKKLREIAHANPATSPTAAEQAALVRRAARSKVSAAEWTRIARGVRDPFREKLRDALLHVLVPRYFDSASEVYATLLVDPEMSPAQLTSRVVQATNSVQVFVQRSLLHLDPEVKLPATAGKEWEWRKSYRVWEANRKVFLYPENWIDPALRDDKTPLFKELETRLSQGELTDEAAESALAQYLNGLAQIANLEVMALCDENDEDGDLVATHVVARTRSAPHHYYHRRRTPLEGWLSWQPMSLDIEGEGVLLTAQNRHVHVFWPLLTSRPNEAQTAAPADSEETATPTLRVDVQVAYSTLGSEGWGPRKISTGTALSIDPSDDTGVRGVAPQLVSLVLASVDNLQEGQIPVGVVARRSFAVNGSPSVLDWPYALCGVMVFDPCGGQWTAVPKSTHIGVDIVSDNLARYDAPLPFGAEFLSKGIQRLTTGGAVSVPRPMADSEVTFSVPILANRPNRYRLVTPSTPVFPHLSYDKFTLEDDQRTLFVRIDREIVTEWYEASKAYPAWGAGFSGHGRGIGIGSSVKQWASGQSLQTSKDYAEDTPVIEPFSHPHVCEMARRLAARGVSGLLGWKNDHRDSVQFAEKAPEGYGDSAVPKDVVDFAHGGPYCTYNWELFFHVPVLMASRLSAEGRYEAAQKWLHFVFDPTGGPSEPAPRRFWRFRPFYENHDLEAIQQDLAASAGSSSAAAEIQALVSASNAAKDILASLQQQLAVLAEDPFNPHALARHRTLAYQKAVVMQYIDNLLDWGDALFRRDTLESMHEALSVYLLAGDLLGPRPETIAHKADPEGKTFEELRSLGLDFFGNAALSVESVVPAEPPSGWKPSFDGPPPPDARLYFCVPRNDMLLGYWDRVSDRLFKLRNGMNIDGVIRQLPLFSPPIDPAILVRAAAAGVSLDKVLDGLAAPTPLFRFLRLHSKAVELASHVAGLGQSLLGAIEKRDGEGLSRLRQTHERDVLDAEREVRKGSIEEARRTLEGLQRQRRVIADREEYYRTLPRRIAQERAAFQSTKDALALRGTASDYELGAEIAAKVPQFASGIAGSMGSPLSSFEVGGQTVALVLGGIARRHRDSADKLATESGQLQTEAGYLRRDAEWTHQQQQAFRELEQMDKQIAAQEIRVALAEREMDNLDLRRSQSREIEDVLRTKFSNTELYDWMVSEVAAEHYRAYQVAYDMAKKAERAYQLERGDDNAVFIRFGAWDSLKRGLLAGERLLADLRALDAAYLSRTDREREITKHVSLAELAHAEGAESYLVKLRDTGTADNIVIPEWLFDADYPGHYFRRLKAVSVSVATVRNAVDGVQCELTLVESSTRRTASLKSAYASSLESPVPHHVKALSTSTADDDAGLFQLDLRDEKLLPFEGYGAVSTWRVDVPAEQNRFPLHRISDVVLHLRYTARDAGATFRTAALSNARSADVDGQNHRARRVRTLSARAEAPEGWARFLAGQSDPTIVKNRLEVPLSRAGFLSFFGNPRVHVVGIAVSATFAESASPPVTATGSLPFHLTLPPASGNTVQSITGLSLPFRRGEPRTTLIDSNGTTDFQAFEVGTSPATILLDVVESGGSQIASAIRTSGGLLKPDALEDLWLSFTYEEEVS